MRYDGYIHNAEFTARQIGYTMLLPATGVEIASDDWKLVRFHEYKDESTDTRMSFDADILHIPTGLVLIIGNTGRSDEHDYGVGVSDRKTDVPRETQREVMAAWDALTVASLPIFRAEAHTSPYPVFRDLWDGENHRTESLRDRLFECFLAEDELQKAWGRKRKVIVRHSDDGKVYEYKTTDPNVLKGRVDGSYWDKKVKNWVAL